MYSIDCACSGWGIEVRWPSKTWAAGVTLFRVHPVRYNAGSFNPNTQSSSEDIEQGGRFHPFEDKEGRRIPTVYLADHPLGALAETLLRDSSGNRKLRIDDVRDNQLATLRFKKPLALVDLNHHSLSGGYKSLLMGDHRVYRATRLLAGSIYAGETWANGLCWNGKQLGISGMKCVVLFGDRIPSDEVEILESVKLAEEPGLSTLREAAVMRDFTLPDEFL